MANTLRIKRRSTGGAAGAPASLLEGELAYNQSDLGNGILYYGGASNTIYAIGGGGAYVSLTGNQTTAASLAISGNKDFTGTVSFGASTTGVTATLSDNTTKLATTAFVKGQGYGTGSVTSVGLSLPAFITVTNSPVTGSGTLTGTLASQTANTVFIAPDGSAGAPTFRSLVSADIPNLDTSKLTSGTLGLARGGTGSTDGSITGSGALTYTAGGTNTNINLVPNGTGTVDVASKRITNVATPTQATDAVNKSYADSLSNGLDVKASVRAASTANVTVTYTATGGTSARGQITAAPNTLDGVSLAANDRILLKDQNTGAQNGIYVVSTLGSGSNGVWDRATDFDADAEVTAGAFTFVEEGTTNADSGWVLSSNQPIVIGGASGTALTFVQFSGAGQITAGAGLTKSGNTLDVASTGGGSLTITADSINLTSGIATAGTYRSVTVDTYGRVTAGTTPTTFSGYGISDTSANLAAAITDETGSGALVFGTSPSLTTPALSGETFSTTNNVTAGTNSQGQGALTSDFNVITTASSNPSGVTLPTATQGRRVVIVNKGANTVNVYPASGGTIDALAQNTSIALPANQVMIFNASSTTQWYSSYNLNTVAGSSGVTSFSAGTTGFTPNTATTGAVTLSGTLSPANGGTGIANNASHTITLGGAVSTGGALTLSGAFATTLTVTASTSLTLPTTGTVLSSDSTVDCGTY